ncbi:MAG: S9 family peptidase [Gemmatimonadetes bacterium]|nr:S9 family peptidase [Gemmatimonadota bacterium]MYD14023.1 S9 family peptidase [Gemmatimonadota bacterium]MYI66187.1 S9 family peptidase [Gemmatimonadota bacterium]
MHRIALAILAARLTALSAASASLGVVAILAALAAIAAPAAAQSRFESMDVFQLEYAADPQIAPRGNTVVYVRTSMDIMKDRKRSEIWTVNLAGSFHRRLAAGSSPRWSPDGMRVAYIADGQIHLRWMDTGETTALTQLTESPSGIRWSPDGRHIAFNMLVPYAPPSLAAPPKPPAGAEWADPPIMEDRFKSTQDGVGYLDFGYTHIFVVSADGGTPTQVTSGDFNHSSAAAWTSDSRHLVFSSNRNPDWERDFRNSELYIAAVPGLDGGTEGGEPVANAAPPGEIRALTDRSGPDHSPAISREGDRIAFVGYEDRTRTYQVSQLQVMNLDGSGHRVLTADLDRSVSSPVWAADGSGIYFQYDDEGNTKVGFVSTDGELQVVAEDVGGMSYGRPYGGGSFSVSFEGRVAFNRTRPDMPGEVAWTSGGRAYTITSLNADLLATKTLGEVEEIWWESSFDGRRIQGWIVKPPDFDPRRRYPLVLEIHGGPISNYGDRFSAEIQLLASAGYVVLYANPRGSTSYGEEFGDLLYHNYPGEDYEDLMSGVDAVIAEGYVDENNLFVTGGSAGGIMTAWIVGKTDRFRAAVAQKPVVNWISKTLTADNWYGYYHSRYEGLPWENPDPYWEFSPISLVGNVETPTMMITGEEDLRTPLSESYQMYHALKMRGIDTAVIRLPGASHDMSRRPSQLMAKIANIVAWFEKYRVAGVS